MDVLSLSATIFGIVALAGGAAGYFKASRGDSIIKYQATEIDLRDGKIATLEKDLAALRQACDAKDQTIEKLENHAKELKQLAQGSPMLKKIDGKIDKLLKSKGVQ